MCRRKWFVRGVVVTIIAGCACSVALYQRFTNSAAIRALVLANLQTRFPGAHISVDSARLRLLDGISVTEIRLSRSDDPDFQDVAHIPSAILYHDKEKVLEGELTLRRVELLRPRLKLVRNAGGDWNVAGLSGKLQPNVLLPTLVIRHGTLIVEDRGQSAAVNSLELSDVNLTIVNDPVSAVAIDGSANSEMVGKVHIQARWQRNGGDFTAVIKVDEVPLTRPLIDLVASKCPAGALDGLKVEGKANVRADIAYSPGSPEPIRYDANVTLDGATIVHPRLPIPLEDVHAGISAGNGNVRLERLSARSGRAEIEAHASAPLPFCDRFFEVHLKVKHLDVRPEIFAVLPEKLRELERNYRPTGLATVTVDCARHEGNWALLPGGQPSRVLFLPEDLSARFIRFDYPLRHLAGTIDHNLVTHKSTFDITGQAGAQPMALKGHWHGQGDQVDAQFDLEATAVPFDKTLVDALPPAAQKIAAAFHATGKADIKGHIRHAPGEPAKEFHHEYHVRFHEATMQWDGFPYPLENVSGFLDIFPKSYHFRDCQGTHAGGLVTVKGRSVPVDNRPVGLILEINGQNILIDDTLKKALVPMPGLVKAWETFQPRGRLHFAAVIDRSSAKNEEMDVRVEVRGGAVEPTFFPWALQDVAGQFRFCKNRLDLAQVSGSHDKTRIIIDKGTVDVYPKGGYYVDLRDLQAQGLILNQDFIQALPQCLRGAAASLNAREPIDVKTWLVVARDADPDGAPDFFWDGQAWLKNIKFTTGLDWKRVTGTIASVGRFQRQLQGVNGNFMLERATLLNQPLHDVTGKFQIGKEAPDVLLVGLRAPVFGGDVSGQMRAEFHSGLKYEMNLTASQIDLAEFGKHNLGPKSALAGQVIGRLHLTGDSSGADTLDGNGSLDMPSGKILDLPLLIDLLKFLGLRWPDRTLFEEMHALFGIRGRRLAVRRLDLVGNVVSLSGKGEVNLDGSDVQLDFYPSWARIEQLLPPAVRPIPPVISKNLLTIEARGKVSADPKELKFHKKPVPLLVDPLLNVRDRMLGPTIERSQNETIRHER